MFLQYQPFFSLEEKTDQECLLEQRCFHGALYASKGELEPYSVLWLLDDFLVLKKKTISTFEANGLGINLKAQAVELTEELRMNF